jgi:hypothetical protein
MGPSPVSRGRSVTGGVALTGGAVGTTVADGSDEADDPTAERATTETVYETPASPPSTQLVAPVVEQVAGPGEATAR